MSREDRALVGPHGGDVSAVARALGVDVGQILDLSASLNPFADDLRPMVARHVEAGALGRYPDDAAAGGALAGAMGVEPDQLVLTNGGAEAIALVAQVLGEGWVEEPEFSLYRRHLVRVHPDAGRWRSNPNNPGGQLAAADDRAAVWDEAFFALATGRWTRGDAERGSIVVGSLTKLFACPGLRIGYVLASDAGVLEAVRSRRPRWSVNGLVCGALPDLVHQADLPRWSHLVAEARSELVGVLGAHGMTASASDANWVLVEAPPGFRQAMATHLILVRDCASFGLPGTVRIAVPDGAGLERLDGALSAVLQRSVPGPTNRVGSRPRSTPAGHLRRPGRGVGGVSGRSGVAAASGSWAGLRGAIMVCGTGSDAGKSAVVAGLCRLLARRGVSVAPFKAQNMALNSWVTDDGSEIGRAQAVQAMAAGVVAEAAMNPVLLKPTGTRHSQVVVLGRPWAELGVDQYRNARAELAPIVHRSLADLRARFDVVVCEGAGSAAEINLLDGDFVNLGLAVHSAMPAVVVGDIDRGGVFASLYGTVGILPRQLSRAVAGFVINKFRGDADLLRPGIVELQARTGVPVLGVLPWLPGMDLDAEDSLALDRLPMGVAAAPVAMDVAVIRFPHLSNATDVDALVADGYATVRLVDTPAQLGQPDLVVLPGTKATVEDLAWLRHRGLADALDTLRRSGSSVFLGVCGGYQMMGHRIVDLVESGAGTVAGLGWLPVDTVFEQDKITRRRRGILDHRAAAVIAGSIPTGRGPDPSPVTVGGYEIHHGRLMPAEGHGRLMPAEGHGRLMPAEEHSGGEDGGPVPWLQLDDEHGQIAEGMADLQAGVLGTSLHGLLEHDSFRYRLLAWAAWRGGRPEPSAPIAFADVRHQRLERLADAIADHLDLQHLLDLVASASTVPVSTKEFSP